MFKFFFLLGFNLQKLLAIRLVRVQLRYCKVQIKNIIYYLGNSRVKNSFFLSKKPRSSFSSKKNLYSALVIGCVRYWYRFRKTQSFGLCLDIVFGIGFDICFVSLNI